MKTKIIQITADPNSEIIGLGENNKVYIWDYYTGQWKPYKS
jgi:hypothetical protein